LKVQFEEEEKDEEDKNNRLGRKNTRIEKKEKVE
jgi:hypothetical protein